MSVIVFFVLFPFATKAQQLNIRDFVLYGNNNTQIGTSTIITGGRIGSNQLVSTVGNTNITASIHSANLVQLSNSNTIKGNISAQNLSGSSGTIFSAGSNFSFPNTNARMDIGGNVVVQSGTISGTLYMPKDATYSGPRVTRKSPPVFPTMPNLPTIGKFPAAGINDVTTTTTLQPNTSNGNLILTGSKTVTFSGTGVYTFKSIKISNQDNKFILDFKGSSSGSIVIQVHDDADLDKLNVQLVGGNASRVYMEVHGKGTTSPTGTDAWRIANGSSGSLQGIWYGAVWAPYGGIFVGQGSTPSKIEGALWSGTNVTLASGVAVTYVQPVPCPDPVADAGLPKTITCPETQVSIGGNGTSSGPGFNYKWTTTVDGVETVVGSDRTINVTRPGTYTLTVSNDCGITASSSVEVSYVSCIDPINPNTGKVDNVIGHELTYLITDLEEAKKHLIILDNDQYVLIEAVAVVGKEAEAKKFLEDLGLLDEIPNGLDYQIISGKFPIANLNTINTRPDIINHCRPVFLPVSNAGVVTSEGDKAIAADSARGGFNIAGEGIKIGVISDSYNKSSDVDRAQQDVQNDDLPGTGNLQGNTLPVDVIRELDRRGSDEGRAILQILHDLAPKSELAFRTGFNSAGDMALGIVEMKNRGCKIIVDDVSYITEPFFQDGVVAKAVDQVTSTGVTYFTSAGNFGQKSYSSTFRRATAPNNLGFAHDFSGTGDIYQHMKLKSGTYTIMLQWKDNIYSLAQTTGTINDLDMYLVDQGGRIGFNRNNLGGDPFEVLSFSINLPDTSQTIDADLLIVKADNSADNPLFKYVIFRGNAVVSEYYSEQPLVNKSTITGHANARGSIAVGAVLFSNTQPYGNTPSIASFSSSGGTPVYVNGVAEVRHKPEITAPNGVNTSTTVVMGPDKDFVTDPINGTADGYPNFYGTSAAAPHAAAAAALMMNARKKFYAQDIDPTLLRQLLFGTAIPMQPDGVVNGWNYKAGYGLVQPYTAIRQFGNPTPKLNQLVYDTDITPGTTTFTLQVTGDYLSANTVIYFRGAPLPTTKINDNTLQAEIGTFTGNPAINLYTPPFPGSTNNGGLSNTLYFFTVPKLKVVYKADDKEMKYGEVIPPNTLTITVDGEPLADYNQNHNTNLTQTSLGLDVVQYTYADPNLNPLSDVGPYAISVTRTFDPTNPTDVGLLELYDYEAVNGKLEITKMPVTISPQDFTATYGDQLNNRIQFKYVFDPTANIADLNALTNDIRTTHATYVDNSVLGVMNSTGGTAVVFFQNQMLSVYNNAIVIYQNKVYPVLSNTKGAAVIILNGKEYPVINKTDGSAAVILNGTEYPVVNGSGAAVILNGEIFPVVNKTDGSAVVLLNGTEYPVVNSTKTGTAVVIINNTEYPVINGVGGAVIILNGEYHPVINKTDGSAAVILNGTEYPVINSTKTGSAAVIFNGTEYPVVNAGGSAGVILNGNFYTVQANGTGGASIILNGVVQTSNAPYLNGVGGSAAVLINGKIEPVFNKTGGAAILLNGTEYPVVNGTKSGTASVIINNIEYPVVNSVSPTTLANMSTSATLNAIANARVVNTVANKFVDIAANAFVQFNTNSASSTMLNTFAAVNRTLVDANRLANGDPVLVNTTRGTAVTILNGSTSLINSNTLSNPDTKTPVVLDQADLNSATSGTATISVMGINMITGINNGTQFVIPATLFSPNFDITYNVGTATILKSPLGLTANNLTKSYGEALTINQAGFTVTNGSTKYTEKVAVANISSQGAAADAPAGNYDVLISNAMGSYGTDINNYDVAYTKGMLSVIINCPVLTHSRNSNFVNTPNSPVSLWLNIQIKVRGQLAKAGDSVVFRAGKLVLENVRYENSDAVINVPRGVVIASPDVQAPVSFYDVTRGVFITKVPVGFSSTADIFISGALVNSRNGFAKGKNSGTVLSGIFQSNVPFDGQWNYSMAAYLQKDGNYVQYPQLQKNGDIVAMSTSTYKAGTPLPWISLITYGGTGNGGSNYTGSPSNYDNFTACVVTTNDQAVVTTRVKASTKTETVSDIALQVYPNPAGAQTTLSFVPNEAGNVRLRMFRADGVQIEEVFHGSVEANRMYTKRIDTQKWAKGVYIIQLVLKDRIITRKLVIAR